MKKQPAKVFCKRSCLKNFANFTGKHLCWKLPATLLNGDSNADVFL